VVITGTGRSGTTFLVELLAHLGLDTGYNIDDINAKKKTIARAGLEHDIRLKKCPYIVKNPLFCDYAEEVLAREDIIIEHVFIPVRNLQAAAQSRRYVNEANFSNMPLLKKIKRTYKPKGVAGGLWDINPKEGVKQEEILLQKMYKLFLALSDTSIPITLMRYPRIVKDCAYLFEKLKPILGDMDYNGFSFTFNKTVRLDMVHSFSKDDC
jgi:hypothetical protein